MVGPSQKVDSTITLRLELLGKQPLFANWKHKRSKQHSTSKFWVSGISWNHGVEQDGNSQVSAPV